MHTCIYICLITDACDFDRPLVERAFTDRYTAEQWGEDKCAALRAQHPVDMSFAPTATVRSVEWG